MTCIHYNNIIECLHCLVEILHALPVHLCLHLGQPLMVLLPHCFAFSRIVGIIQRVAFSDRLLSLSRVR